MFDIPDFGTKCICAVCNKEFIRTDEHMFIRNNGLVCSWKCFKVNTIDKENKESVAEKATQIVKEDTAKTRTINKVDLFSVETPIKRKRGRPRKNPI